MAYGVLPTHLSRETKTTVIAIYGLILEGERSPRNS